MSESYQFQPTVVRTHRGLSIAGTRITLYQIMDYVNAKHSPNVIRDHFRLTVKQTEDALTYIEQHRDEMDVEYQRVLKHAEANRQYWQQRNAQRFADIASRPRKPEHQAIWEKLDALKRQAA